MAKAPFVCKLFGHSYRRLSEAWSSCQVCVRCNHQENPIDCRVYWFEVSQWHELVLRTGRSLSDLQNDQMIRDQVWQAVTVHRTEIG